MILKLRTGIDLKTSWRLIDNIEQIDYKYIDEPKEFEENDDYINSFPNVKDKRITQIDLRIERGLVQTIFTDDIVYILNNNGKTCDTINI